MIAAPTRAAWMSIVVAFLLVAALVLAARLLLADTHHRPPHQARPAADATQEHPAITTPALTPDEATMLADYLDSQTTTTAPPPATTTVAPAPSDIDPKTFTPDVTPHPLDNPDGFLACVRARESGGDYTIHELTGASQAAGAYQFLPSTWDQIARDTGRYDLVGIDPAAASPADQDAMAEALYAQQGAAPWGGGCP